MVLLTAQVEITRLVLDDPDAALLQVSVVNALNTLHESELLQARHAELLQRLSFDGCMPRDRAGRVVIPRQLQLQMLQEGATSADERLSLDSWVSACGDAPIRVDGEWVQAESVWDRSECRLAIPDAERGQRLVPTFRKATASLSFSVDEAMIDVATVARCLENALNLTGIGMLRPSFGRGRVLRIEHQSPGERGAAVA